MTRHRLPIGFALAGLLASAVAAQAAADVTEPASAELAYKQYHAGIHAAVECRGAKFSASDYRELESRIQQRAGESVHVGRKLQLIQDAKTSINTTLSGSGCTADRVQEALAQFDTLRGYTPQ